MPVNDDAFQRADMVAELHADDRAGKRAYGAPSVDDLARRPCGTSRPEVRFVAVLRQQGADHILVGVVAPLFAAHGSHHLRTKASRECPASSSPRRARDSLTANRSTWPNGDRGPSSTLTTPTPLVRGRSRSWQARTTPQRAWSTQGLRSSSSARGPRAAGARIACATPSTTPGPGRVRPAAERRSPSRR